MAFITVDKPLSGGAGAQDFITRMTFDGSRDDDAYILAQNGGPQPVEITGGSLYVVTQPTVITALSVYIDDGSGGFISWLVDATAGAQANLTAGASIPVTSGASLGTDLRVMLDIDNASWAGDLNQLLILTLNLRSEIGDYDLQYSVR